MKVKEGRKEERKKEKKEGRKEGKAEERKKDGKKDFFQKYQVNKIKQNYNNAVYKWVKSDDFLRG